MPAEVQGKKRARATYEEVLSLEVKHAEETQAFGSRTTALNNFVHDDRYDHLLAAQEELARVQRAVIEAEEQVERLRAKFLETARVKMPEAPDPEGYESYGPGQFVKDESGNAGIVSSTTCERNRAWGIVGWQVTNCMMEPFYKTSHMSELTITDLATANGIRENYSE